MSYLVRTEPPKLYRSWKVEDLVGATNIPEIHTKTAQYLADPKIFEAGNNLYIFSPGNGNGKGILANYIAYKLHQPRLEEGKVVVKPMAYIKFGEYLISRGEFTEVNSVIRECIMTVPILILDDVSPAFCSGNPHNDKRELTLLMSHRREDMNVTIITSNLTPEKFEKIFGMTVASKVLENFSYIEIQGKDVRQALYPDQLEDDGFDGRDPDALMRAEIEMLKERGEH